MPSCAIKWCGKNSSTSSYKKDNITYHRFPKDPDRKASWISATYRRNWFPSSFSVVCSRHFTSDCFEQIKRRRRLFSTAIPTLYLPKLVSTEENSQSDNEEPSTSTLTQASTDENPLVEEKHKDTSSTSNKVLCRKIIDLNKKLQETKRVVKRLKDSNRFLRSKVNTMQRLLEKLKNKELITKEFIDIDRLQNSNKQLRKKVALLKKLLDEQKKKNLLNRQNTVWCPAPEQSINTEETLVVDQE